MWKMYDALLEQVQAEDRIELVRAGRHWVLVKTEQGAVGVAAVQTGRSGQLLHPGEYSGMRILEAAKLVNEIHPLVAIPIHYGSIVGKPVDADVFRKHVNPEIQVETRL